MNFNSIENISDDEIIKLYNNIIENSYDSLISGCYYFNCRCNNGSRRGPTHNSGDGLTTYLQRLCNYTTSWACGSQGGGNVYDIRSC